MTPLMLGIETATALTSVALVRAEPDGDSVQVLDERSHRDGRKHGEVLPRLLAESLQAAGQTPAGIAQVVVGVGPGAYTGLRVGIATAEAIGLSLGVLVSGVGTLDAIAFATGRAEPFAVVTDARRRELFLREYRDYRTPLGPTSVIPPDELALSVDELPLLAPDGTPALPDRPYLRCADPSAAAVCQVALDRTRRGLPWEPARPQYLRRPDVSPTGAPKSVLR